ncbi:hypothetical protein [Aeromonas enteropelogenes]|uniref:hypothetical protein n=1 Tax=Aeromonas enteropelogenes TaxID=29489 RepID=UPI003B9E24BE
MSTIQQIAEWIHTRKHGVLSSEIAKEFSITTIKASDVLSQIHRKSRFTTRVKYTSIEGHHARRLYVDQVLSPQWYQTPVIGTNSRGQVVRFSSVTEAEHVGGFFRSGITRCLAGKQGKHGGYRWQVDEGNEHEQRE